MLDDAELLRRYSESGAESAFTELVRRHLNLVYFTALRRTCGDTALAQDIAQSVFSTAAGKARSLASHASLAGWLYTTTRHLADRAVRKEQTRRRYEEAAAMDPLTITDESPEWERIRPFIDGALDEMTETDREVILVRFFEGRGYADIGSALQISEDAARMRAERALEKLKRLLHRRGIRSAAAALAVALATQGSIAVPAGMVTVVSGAAMASVAAASGTTAIFGFMSISKITTITASIAAISAGSLAVIERNRAQSAEANLAAMTEVRDSLQASIAEAEKRAAQAYNLAEDADRDSASLLAAIEATRRQDLLQKSLHSPQVSPASDDPLTRSLDGIFPDGIVAVVAGRTITVDEIRRKIAPQLPKLQADARDHNELGHRLNKLQNTAIKDAVERILLIKEFSNHRMTEEPRHVAPAFVEQAMAEILKEQFANDTGKFAAFLQSRGMTHEQYRREVEENIAYGYMRQQQRRLESANSNTTAK
jgi:RNA polymerase sigma factor (sigma-70 family)